MSLRPTAARLALMHAANKGKILHSPSGGWDWEDRGVNGDPIRTQAVAVLKRAGLIELAPLEPHHKFRGQPYRWTDAGRRWMAAHGGGTT